MSEEIKQLLEMLNDNEDNKVFTEEDWVVKSVRDILERSSVGSINIYGLKDIDSLKEDISSMGTEVNVDADNNFVSLNSSKIELYTRDEDQYLDFEIDNVVSIIYKEDPIKIIEDLKESDDIEFDENKEMIIYVTEYIYTTDRGLSVNKVLTIYVPFNLTEILDEEVDF